MTGGSTIAAMMLNCRQAAGREQRLMAVTVNSRQRQEPDFRYEGRGGQGQLSVKHGNSR